jgi:hypothetical protein
MNANTLGILALAVTASGALAQTYDELPAGGYTTTVDQIYDPYLVPATSYLPLHLQYAYSTNDIPVAGALITELAWHRNNYYSNTLPAGSLTCVVTLATSPNTPATMSNTFASNLVNIITQVFNGTVNFPATAKGTGPAPYDQKLVLTTPYPYAKGTNQSLVIDIVTTAVTGYVNSTYTMDASAPDAGTRSENGGPQSACKFSSGSYNSGLSYTLGGLNNNGGIWYVQYNSLLANVPGVAVLSLFGVDNPGPWPLPINLGGFGAPSCNWNVGLDLPAFNFAIAANASGQAKLPNVTIPAGLGGLNFYDHTLFLDQAAPGGLVVGWASKWHIGTLKGPAANTLYRTADTGGSPTGTIRSGYGTHVRLSR